VAARRLAHHRLGTGERALAAKADPGQDVYLVPAFVGLGAPTVNPRRAARCSA
jgi:glycerol kinase